MATVADAGTPIRRANEFQQPAGHLPVPAVLSMDLILILPDPVGEPRLSSGAGLPERDVVQQRLSAAAGQLDPHGPDEVCHTNAVALGGPERAAAVPPDVVGADGHADELAGQQPAEVAVATETPEELPFDVLDGHALRREPVRLPRRDPPRRPGGAQVEGGTLKLPVAGHRDARPIFSDSPHNAILLVKRLDRTPGEFKSRDTVPRLLAFHLVAGQTMPMLGKPYFE